MSWWLNKSWLYGPAPTKTGDFVKLRTEIKQAFQKTLDEKKITVKALNDYAKVIQSIRKEYQNVNRENEYLKKELKKYEEKGKFQQRQNEIKKEQQQDRKNNNKKYRRYESRNDSNDLEYFDHQRSEKQKRKQKFKKNKYCYSSRL